jgi:hypothetical protein
VGLKNKMINLRLKVWEPTYQDCKDQVQKAATILRSNRGGFAPLYIQYTDRYYEAMPETIRMEKSSGTSVRMLEYDIDFLCKPWLVGETTSTITGSSLARARTTLSTSARAYEYGGWTFAKVTVTGSDITLSGYTNTGDFAGFLSVSGAVTSLIVDTELFSATQAGVNKNSAMRYADYRMFVGPTTTSFVVSGATDITITYNNRWYI